MLVDGIHVGLSPSRAAVAGAVNEAVVGDESLGGIVGGDGEVENDFAIAPTPVATLAGPTRDDVLIVGGAKRIGPRNAGVGGFEDNGRAV